MKFIRRGLTRINADSWWRCLPAALALAALSAPLLSGHPLAAWAIREFFSRVCHQDPARSFWVWGVPVAVCARCFGIYLGAAVGAWVGWSRQLAVWFLAVAAAVNALDVLSEMAGLHGNWMDVRFVLGAALGVGMAAAVVAATSPQEHGVTEEVATSLR